MNSATNATGEGHAPQLADRANRVKVGFFSLTHASPTGDDRPYLEWHQLDHMPEQYQLPGLVLGQRWASTPECRRARAAEVEGWSSVEHAVCYLMGEPVDQTVDEFLHLGRELAEVGRYPQVMPSRYRGALQLVEAVAAQRVLVSSQVVPFRPHRGVYLVVDEPEGGREEELLRGMRAEVVPELVSVPGVAGVWSYSTSPSMRRRMFTEGDLRVTVCYLDDGPVAVAGRLSETVERLWARQPARLLLAAPFESVLRWDWEHFGAAGSH
jgi:hypothetical protein